MTELQTLALFNLAPTRGRKQDSVGKSRLSKMACIVFVFCVSTAISLPAQTVTTLASFDLTNGAFPYSSLVQGFDGNFYGTTPGGGAYWSGNPFTSGGTVFKLTLQGKLTALYSFCAQADCTDGEQPRAGLVLTPGGNFYGTTTAGGTYGSGTFFKITPRGKLTTIYNFCRQTVCPPGSGELTGPGAIIQATDDNFYGTAGGGTNGAGAIFKITPEGTLTALYSFCAEAYCGDGNGPNSPLVEGTDGNFYGTTGITLPLGAGQVGNAGGTVFKITPEGTLTTLQSFTYGPAAGLVQGADGKFYGTTFYGGWCDVGGGVGCGTVFEISPEGSYNTIYNFLGYGPDYGEYDGENPAAPLVQATDGNFYGTTINGGTQACDPGSNVLGCGTIFGVTLGVRGGGPEEILLYPFCSQAVCPNIDPLYYNPALYGQLLQATNGNFYGTASFGLAPNTPEGGLEYGMVYSMSLGLAPFVSLVRSFGHVGQTVQILGQGFTGATAVSFNGTPATFTVKSDTYVTATVPAGATNGFVTVTEPGGTLTSNKTFVVTPQILSFSPTSGPVGTSVVITGHNFTGAMFVTLACKWLMSFTVDSDTQITAIVPAAAITGSDGTIAVRTPDGRVESTARFTVTP